MPKAHKGLAGGRATSRIRRDFRSTLGFVYLPGAGLWPYSRPVDKSPGVEEYLFLNGNSGSRTHPSVEAVTRATLFASVFRRVTPELAILTDFHARVQLLSSSPAFCMGQAGVGLNSAQGSDS